MERLPIEHLPTKTKNRRTIVPTIELARKGNSGLRSTEPHTCYICKKIISNRSCLSQHLKSVHGESPAMFCDQCPKVFFVKTVLQDHMKGHSTKVFACNICDYKSARIHNFRRHKSAHFLKEKCKICDKNVVSLEAHLRKVHQPREVCPICNKQIRSYKIKEHIWNHEGNRYKCKDCGETLPSAEFLRR